MAKWGSADFEELKALADELLEMEKEVNKFCEIAARALARRLLGLVRQSTPLGNTLPHPVSRAAPCTVAGLQKRTARQPPGVDLLPPHKHCNTHKV